MKILFAGLLAFTAMFVVVGCGGGGSSDPAPVPTPSPTPSPTPQTLTVQDSLPGGAVSADPERTDVTFSHFGFSDLTVQYSGACATGSVVRRTLVGLSDQSFDQLLDHKLQCAGLAANQMITTGVDGERPGGDQFEAELTFSTGVGSTPGVNIVDTVANPAATVETLFQDYFASALLPELDLDPLVETLVAASISQLTSTVLSNLAQPTATYGVTTQRVTYPSRDPSGNASSALTGLIAVPDTSGAFTPRDRVIVLMHSTGSTPGDLEATNSWFGLANLLAARGYLVIAADNWGRGGTAAEAETYLMANRTAANSVDLLQAVLADGQYDAFLPATGPVELAILGYSQGGHSAMALWQALITQGTGATVVREVYAGGAPHNLYRTFRGVVEHVDDSCNAGVYCRYVSDAVSVPFVTDRALPGFLDYTDIGLTTADIVDGDTLSASFVTGFLANEPAYDKMKVLLQQSSFTNVASVAEAYGASDAELRFYHSDFDRLVAEANTQELVDLLSPTQSVEYRDGVCNLPEFQTIFNLTDVVGIVHVLCGLTMMNDVVVDLN